MSDDDLTLEMSMPLDSDGFLRRECPTCEREFKWYYTSDEQGDAAPIADGGYFCPYCGVQAETNTWLTQAQAGLAQNMVATQVLGPMLEEFGDDMKGIARSSGGLISAELKYDAARGAGAANRGRRHDPRRLRMSPHRAREGARRLGQASALPDLR